MEGNSYKGGENKIHAKSKDCLHGCAALAGTLAGRLVAEVSVSFSFLAFWPRRRFGLLGESAKDREAFLIYFCEALPSIHLVWWSGPVRKSRQALAS